MKQEGKLLGFYNYTVILTYIGMLFGFVGIVIAFEGRIRSSIICLMAAGFCDMFDGTIASTMKRTEPEKNFGIQIDSLSDVICFGILPAMIVYNLNKGNFFALCVSGLYALCALIRLAYFNVDEAERQKTCSGSRKIYYGMPVTTAALLIPLGYAILENLSIVTFFPMVLCLLLMAALFLIPFRLKKPKLAGKICMLLCGAAEVVLVAKTFLGV